MSDVPNRFDLSKECSRINALLTDLDRATIRAGKNGKPGDWIIETIERPSRFSLKSLQIAINICNGYLASPKRANVPPHVSVELTSAQRDIALRGAMSRVRKFITDDEVAQQSKTTLQTIKFTDVLTPEVTELLESGLPVAQRKGLVLFTVANHGVELVEEHQLALKNSAEAVQRVAKAAKSGTAEVRKLKAGIRAAREKEDAFMAPFALIGVVASRS